MDPLAILSRSPLTARQSAEALTALQSVNKKVAGHGLTLTDAEMALLVQRRAALLQGSGRVEFGEGVLPALAFAFCDSPHIPPADYAALLEELLACFYHYKNELENTVTDSELLDFMRDAFNSRCGGSVEMLSGALETLAQAVRMGQNPAEAMRELQDRGQSGEGVDEDDGEDQ